MMETILRKTVAADVDIVYRFVCELSAAEFDYPVFKNIFIENTSNPNHIYLISETDGRVSGFISCHVQNLLHHSGLVGEIQEFYVDEDFRGKGIGKLLIEKIKSCARQRQLKSIEVTSSKKRKENVLVYEKLGFDFSHNKFTIYDL